MLACRCVPKSPACLLANRAKKIQLQTKRVSKKYKKLTHTHPPPLQKKRQDIVREQARPGPSSAPLLDDREAQLDASAPRRTAAS